ncbi:hypothetical protein ACHAWF_004193 [Thalassiosira exigua]
MTETQQVPDRLESASIEGPLCNYLAAFDGIEKGFEDIRVVFDDLFSDNMIYLFDGRPIDKEAFACINQQLLDRRVVATLEDYWNIDDDRVEYTVHWGNGRTSFVTNVQALVVDGSIALMRPCEETTGVFADLACDCRRSDRVASNRFPRLRGWADRFGRQETKPT